MHGFNFYKFCVFISFVLWLHVYFFFVFHYLQFEFKVLLDRFANEMSGARFWKNVLHEGRVP